ncbi:hypothetical protein Mucpa_2955 [Mucilaginibacter paludis DSM 18603]|uniref:Uncharacterized protein n=1 Tax=Mucilaginibacter paludis DSM 18603 TaxID=714943 RepID=H1YBY5_9SPHI|nr:hypothetical protein Mucpa_2955 [Mucilaginibacter paludis DSM 18603]
MNHATTEVCSGILHERGTIQFAFFSFFKKSIIYTQIKPSLQNG